MGDITNPLVMRTKFLDRNSDFISSVWAPSFIYPNVKLNHTKMPSLKLKTTQIWTISCGKVPYDASKPPSNLKRETSLRPLEESSRLRGLNAEIPGRGADPSITTVSTFLSRPRPSTGAAVCHRSVQSWALRR